MSEMDLMKRIVQIEYKLFRSIRDGHKAHDGDKFHNLRVEVKLLRCLYFGKESSFCKK